MSSNHPLSSNHSLSKDPPFGARAASHAAAKVHDCCKIPSCGEVCPVCCLPPHCAHNITPHRRLPYHATMRADKTLRTVAAAAAAALALCVLLVSLPAAAAGGSHDATVDILSSTGVSATSAPFTSFDSVPVQPCFNAEWAQCAGTQHTGQTCCPRGSGCAYQSEW